MASQSNDSNEPLFLKVIPKVSGKGVQVGWLKIEVKVYDGNKFAQITQRKEAFGSPNSPTYKPAKETWITFNPSDDEIKKALGECFKQ